MRCHNHFRVEESEAKKDSTINKSESKFEANRYESPCPFHFNDLVTESVTGKFTTTWNY